MDRVVEIRRWLQQATGSTPIREVVDYIYRLETVNEELRRRAGELYAAAGEGLTPVEGKNDPDGPFASSRHTNFPTRYVLLDRMVGLASELAQSVRAGDGDMQAEVLGQLVEAVGHVEGYWQLAQAERDARRATAAKAAAARKEKGLAKSA